MSQWFQRAPSHCLANTSRSFRTSCWCLLQKPRCLPFSFKCQVSVFYGYLDYWAAPNSLSTHVSFMWHAGLLHTTCRLWEIKVPFGINLVSILNFGFSITQTLCWIGWSPSERVPIYFSSPIWVCFRRIIISFVVPPKSLHSAVAFPFLPCLMKTSSTLESPFSLPYVFLMPHRNLLPQD